MPPRQIEFSYSNFYWIYSARISYSFFFGEEMKMIAPALANYLTTACSQSIVALPKLSVKHNLIFLFPADGASQITLHSEKGLDRLYGLGSIRLLKNKLGSFSTASTTPCSSGQNRRLRHCQTCGCPRQTVLGTLGRAARTAAASGTSRVPRPA
jgi:hypothetical protein